MLEQLFFRADGLDALRWLLAGVSLVGGIAYLPFTSGGPSPHRTALKTLVIGVLVPLPLTYLGTGAPVATLAALTAALVLSALGDLFLALKDQQRFFVIGLASFLLGHVAYVIAFAPYAAFPALTALVVIALALAAATAMIVWLWPSLGRLRGPVLAYFAVIMSMVATSLSIPNASWILGAGAILFAISDSLIAVRKFKMPFPFIHESVWITYVLAQYMIVAGLLALIVPDVVPA